MASLSMIYDVIARDGASPVFRALGKEIEATATKAERTKASIAASMKKIGAVSAVAVGVIAVESVKSAATFQSQMIRVQTMAGVPQKELKKLSDQILKLAPKVGTGPDALAESLYHVESAGFKASAAIDMVTAAAKLSKIGNADINATTQAIIGVMASKVKGVKDANDAAALILKTVGTGDMTMSQFVDSLSTGVLPTVARVGLSFEDFGAAIATMTDNTIPADQASTKLRTALLMMEDPSGKAADALSSIGLSSTSLATDMRKPNGLQVALTDLREHLNKTFPASGGVPLSIAAQKAAVADYTKGLEESGVHGKELTKLTNQYADSIKRGGSNVVLANQAFDKIFGGSKTAGTVGVLYQEQERYNQKIKQFGDVTSRAKDFNQAWSDQQKTFKQRLADVGAQFDTLKIKLGNQLLPVVSNFIGYLASHQDVVKWLVYAIGTLLVGATVAWTGALLANPVAAVAMGVVAAVALIVKNWGPLSGFFGAVWKDVAAKTQQGVNNVIAIINGFTGMINDITKIFGIPRIPPIGPVGGSGSGGATGAGDPFSRGIRSETGPGQSLKQQAANADPFASGIKSQQPAPSSDPFALGINSEVPRHQAAGGVVPGNHNRDDVPLYGTPGEVMVPKWVVAMHGGASSLMSKLGFAGRGGAGGHYAGGGSILGALGSGLSSAWNGITDIVGMISQKGVGYALDGVDSIANRLIDTIPVKVLRDIGHGLVQRVHDGVLRLVGGASAGAGGVAPDAGNVTGVAALGQQMAAAHGWTGAQWNALNAVAMRESGWNPNAVNASSGAYGIGQSLGHGHPYNLGDAPAQISWMLDYITSRYGNPVAAWAHEQQFGWYDRGGMLQPGLTLAYNGTGRPERVLSHGQGGATVIVNPSQGMDETQIGCVAAKHLDFLAGSA